MFKLLSNEQNKRKMLKYLTVYCYAINKTNVI